MLRIKNISLQQFKNYPNQKLEFCAQVNCFTGKNGSGKTNLLDAIYYLSFTKSFFNPTDAQNILHHEQYFSIQAKYERNHLNEDVVLSFQKGKKTLKLNNNEVKKFSDHIGHYPLVMITPNDIFLLHEGSEERRKFLDGLIAQTDKIYLQYLLQYNRILEQRNKQLKLFAEGAPIDELLIETYNIQLAEAGEIVFTKRKNFLTAFIPLVNHYYHQISNASESIQIVYHSDLNGAELLALLHATLRNDLSAQRTTKGIHKDDLEFCLNEYAIKKFGSQGQQKSFIVALKLAQYDYLKQHTQIKPLLLLDDIFEKLDEQRLQTLLHMIADDAFGQIFITDTHLDRLQAVFQKMPQTTVCYFGVSQGSAQRIMINE